MPASYASPQPSPTYGPRAVPIPSSSKAPISNGYPVQAYYHPVSYSRVSTSPPERAESVTTGGGTYSSTGSSYAGSDSDSSGAGGVDLLDYMHERLSHTIDPLPLDRSLAKQAQSSGELNAKTRELLALQTLARNRLAATRANFADGIKAAREVQRDLEWTHKRVAALNHRAAQKYPTQYRTASAKYPSQLDY